MYFNTMAYVSLLLCIISCTPPKESAILADKIDQVLLELNQKELFNGGVLIAQGDDVILQKAYGYAYFPQKKKLTENTVFQCASISKTFTAVAIFQLIEKGKLSLEDKLTDYFPNLPYPDITIQHLLTHTPGLYPYNPLFEQKWDHKKIATNKDIIEMYEQEKPESFFASGTEFSYCNVGYVFLSSIVEKVSGQSFSDYLEEFIFTPLEMENTQIYTLLSEDTIEDFAQEHIIDPISGKQLNPIDVGYHSYLYYLNGKLGDDKVATTLEDLWKWNRALYKNNFLPQETADIAFTSSIADIPEDKRHSKFDFGLGFQLEDHEKYGKIIYHNGGEPGLRARFHYYPDLDISLIFYANAYSEYTRPTREIILSIITNQTYTLPKKSISNELARVARYGKDSLNIIIDRYQDDTTYYLKESEINNLAGVFWAQEKYDLGFDLLNLNIELFPESVGARYTLGEGFMETDQMAKAIPHFKLAKDLMLKRPKEKQNANFIQAMDEYINSFENGAKTN